MNNLIEQYFLNLEPVQIKKELSKFNITETSDFSSVQKTNINGSPIVIKKSSTDKGLASVASSRMYKKMGINTPELYLLNNKDKQITVTFQSDVSSIAGFITTLAADSVQYKKFIQQAFGRNKWEIFYNQDLIHKLLQFMTPQCLEQFQNIYLVDELRTDNDRHTHNYFFYRTPNSDKYQGIIAIDLDNMVVYNFCNGNREDFKNFLYLPYGSATPQQSRDYICYFDRVNQLRQVLEDDVLSQENINALRNSLKFNLPKELKKACIARGLNIRERHKVVDPIKYLWEYNQNTIGKDLGL